MENDHVRRGVGWLQSPDCYLGVFLSMPRDGIHYSETAMEFSLLLHIASPLPTAFKW